MTTSLRDQIEEAFDQAFKEHLAHMVEILMTATDDERLAFERFKTGAVQTIQRREKLLALLREADLTEDNT